MNVHHSTATSVNEYQPTIIESGLLLSRLAVEIEFLKTELKRARIDFQNDPRDFATRAIRDLVERSHAMVHAIPATSTALVIVTIAICAALLIDHKRSQTSSSSEAETKPELVMLDFTKLPDSKPKAPADSSIGMNGRGRVGFQSGSGEGSGATPKLARGGGGGGDGEPMPPQVGKLPPPSPIVAAIPKAPPIHPLTLPVAGIDIDPALWKDLKAPVFGDPRSNSDVPSKGPGTDGGIGTNEGLGIGPGNGNGYGPGNRRNTGGGDPQDGCCRPGGGNGSDPAFTGREVEQRARLLLKPEPQYTEEARRNQITGTVTLRVVFSSTGEVVQIRALRTLPFGLTERAIAAARQIKFVPALKGGRPVSVHMQLEYNFNLY